MAREVVGPRVPAGRPLLSVSPQASLLPALRGQEKGEVPPAKGLPPPPPSMDLEQDRKEQLMGRFEKSRMAL